MPVPTVAEVLKQSGWSQEKIDALDAQALSGLNTYVTNVYQTAEQKEKEAQDLATKAEADRKAQEEALVAAKAAQDAAELQKRSVDEFWKDTYNPGVAAWEKERQLLAKKASDAAAEAAFYKAQREQLKDTGLILEDAPTFTPPAAPVVEQSKTPGTPTFSEDEFLKRVDRGVYSIQDIGWKYQQLYGSPIPISPSELVAKADAIKLSPMEYAARTFKFAEKDEERRQAVSKAHDDEIAAKSAAAKEAEWKAKLDAQTSEFAAKERKMAEQISTHPDIHLPPGSAKFAEVRRATSAGERPDPTRMKPEDRIKLTQANVHKRIEERQQTAA
jgi:hypothetical protein